mmetsp:Transcript_3900/g.4221  ORF Transcript_3900/g.4221 Transcript_3900/m.4221 type:complete len:176 (+) Transcript_3900:45-572(+)
MIQHPLSISTPMHTLLRLHKKHTDDDRIPPSVTPVHSDNEEECNNEDQSSDCITIFDDNPSTTSLSPIKDVCCFFPVPEQMINYDTYSPLSPEEADEEQLAEFFTDLGEVSFIQEQEEQEHKLPSPIPAQQNDDNIVMTTITKRRRALKSLSDEYDNDTIIIIQQGAKRRRFVVE